MTTARTAQILDSNNNNISPATSIESLYFEMTSKNVRYRMSLRSRFMVADNTIDWNEYKNVDTKDDNYLVPFTYVRAVEGTDNTLWQLTAARYDIKSIIDNYISRYVDASFIHIEEEDELFHRNSSGAKNTISTNVVLTSEKDSLDKQYITLGAVNGRTGIIWKENNARLVKEQNGNLDLGTEATLKLSGSTLDASVFQYVNIGNITNTEINIKGNKVELANQKDENHSSISLSDGNVVISSSTRVNVEADMISLIGSQVSIPDNSSLNIYGKDFPKYVLPVEADAHKYLTVNNMGVVAWSDVDKVKVKPAPVEDASYNVSNTVFIKNVQFGEGESIKLIADKDDHANIRFCSLCDSSDATKKYSLQYSDSQDSIYFGTINGRPVINNKRDTSDGVFNLVEESDSIWTNIKDCAIRSSLPTSETNNGKFVQSISFLGGTLSYTTLQGIDYNAGKLNCRQYVMTSSDERLKTDIKEPEFSGELPDIVQFRWKDTSALTYGVIAQDVERVGLETLVNTNEKTGMKSVSYTELLLLYIKDLQERNKSLEERVKRLERLY